MSAFYRCMGGNGGGVTPTSITPSNSTPAAMSSGGVYQPTANGYAIASYDSKTPSDSTPPSVASGDIVKMGGAGYLYASQQSGKSGKLTGVAINTAYQIDTGLQTIKNFGIISAPMDGTSNGTGFTIYDSNDPTHAYRAAYVSGVTNGVFVDTIGGTVGQVGIYIDSIVNGVVTVHTGTRNAAINYRDMNWFAV